MQSSERSRANTHNAHSVVAVLFVLSLSCASAANSTCASNPWTATGLTSCSLINGHKVESEFMAKIWEVAVSAVAPTLTVDSKEAYDKCRTASDAATQEGTEHESCYANTNACKESMNQWNCLLLAGSDLCDRDKAVETSGKPCHGLCVKYQQACLSFDPMATSILDQVCNLLGPAKGEQCFGDDGFNGMKLVKDPEGTVYPSVVKMALSLEMTEADFTDSKQTSFKQAVADTAIVTVDKVSIDKISTVSTRRNLERDDEVASDTVAKDTAAQVTVQVYVASAVAVLNSIAATRRAAGMSTPDVRVPSTRQAATPEMSDMSSALNEAKGGTGRALLAASIKVELSIKAKDTADATSLSAKLTSDNLNTHLVAQGLPKATILERPSTSLSSGAVFLAVTKVTSVLAVAAAFFAA